MNKTNEEIEKSEGLQELSDNELLAVVNEVIASEEQEVAKSESASEESSEEIEKGKMSAAQKELDVDQDGEVEGEDLAELRKKKMKKGEEVESEEVEKGNVSTPADHGKPEDGPGPGETVDEVAERKKKKMKEKDLGHTDGKADGMIDPEGTTGQGATKESRSKDNKTSYYKSEDINEKVEQFVKSAEAILAKFDAMEKRVEALEKSEKPAADESEIRKSVSAEITERVAKSFFTESEELKKSVAAALSENENLRKSISEKDEKLEKAITESEELRKSLKKPANTRQAINNLDAIEKAAKEEEQGRLYKSKSDVYEALDELHKSGKVSGDDIISFNVSGFLSDKTKKLLKGMK